MPYLMPVRKVTLSLRRGGHWGAATVDGRRKGRSAAESFEEVANISEGARRNGVLRGLLTVRRRQIAAAEADKSPNFVAIQIGAGSGGKTAGESERISSAQTTPLEIVAPPVKACGPIEIEVSGARTRVDPHDLKVRLKVISSNASPTSQGGRRRSDTLFSRSAFETSIPPLVLAWGQNELQNFKLD